MAPGGSTRANSQEDLGHDEEEASKPIVSGSTPDIAKNNGPHPVVKFAEMDSRSVSEKPEEDDEDKDANSKSNLENFKYYTSLFLGTLCLVCNFVFLFLVPFVLDPAISTLTHKFIDEPVSCKVSSQTVRHGKSNCLWSSCREGCTADVYQCYQVRVVYTHKPWVNGTRVDQIPPDEWVDLARFDRLENKTMHDTPLLVNIKGCGYPPDITCPLFADKYENITERGDTFPCYYSKVNPWIVIETYDYSENLAAIISSIVIPNVIFIVGLVVLLFWYCPYCQTKCGKYEEQADEEEQEETIGIEDNTPQSPF